MSKKFLSGLCLLFLIVLARPTLADPPDRMEIASLDASGVATFVISPDTLMATMARTLNNGSSMIEATIYDSAHVVYSLIVRTTVDTLVRSQIVELSIEQNWNGGNSLYLRASAGAIACEIKCNCNYCKPIYSSGMHLLSCDCGWLKEGECTWPRCQKALGQDVIDVPQWCEELSHSL